MPSRYLRPADQPIQVRKKAADYERIIADTVIGLGRLDIFGPATTPGGPLPPRLARGTESLQTRRWSEADSNRRSHFKAMAASLFGTSRFSAAIARS
jgi:hypothetical protein